MKCPNCETGVVINKCPNAWKPECVECGALISPEDFASWRHEYSLRCTTDFPDYTVFKRGVDGMKDVFWCTEATIEDARYRCAVETHAYSDTVNYTFGYKYEMWNRNDDGEPLI